MAVRQHQYGREMDKSKKGESLQERHNQAVKKSQVMPDGKKYDEEGLLVKTKKRLKKLFGGGQAKKETPKETAKKPYLKAGIEENELRALRPNLYKKEK